MITCPLILLHTKFDNDLSIVSLTNCKLNSLNSFKSQATAMKFARQSLLCARKYWRKFHIQTIITSSFIQESSLTVSSNSGTMQVRHIKLNTIITLPLTLLCTKFDKDLTTITLPNSLNSVAKQVSTIKLLPSHLLLCLRYLSVYQPFFASHLHYLFSIFYDTLFYF